MKKSINRIIIISLEQLKELLDLITKKPLPAPVPVRKNAVYIMKNKNDLLL